MAVATSSAAAAIVSGPLVEVAQAINAAQSVCVLTGAGVSVSAGTWTIPTLTSTLVLSVAARRPSPPPYEPPNPKPVT